MADTTRLAGSILQQRNREAELLYIGGEYAGAIYLWGYVAEGLLKAAFLRLLPHLTPRTEVPLHVLRAELQHAYSVGQPNEQLRNPNLHDVRDLIESIVRKRRQIGRDYSDDFVMSIRGQLDTIHESALVEMRYFPLRPSTDEAMHVRQAVEKLVDLYPDL